MSSPRTPGLSRDLLNEHTTSFADLVGRVSPELLPAQRSSTADLAPTATTIVALTTPDAVVMAGDRRATMGHTIAQRDIEKVFGADEYSLVGIAGSAGLSIEMVRLFRVELEHYEKLEGVSLSLDGKANRLSALIRGNLGLALQGFVVVPLLAGWDQDRAVARIFSYDATGGRYEESHFFAVGSGAPYARGALKKLYRPDFTVVDAVTAAVQSLVDAADDDAATGGPDLARRIFPVVWVASADGVRRVPDIEVGEAVDAVVSARRSRPDGPGAPLL
ncbi:MAG TPA: proteasome subunit beta [Propionibacteriaceae bacterium]|nr:proteasome subunit beta [Propionibacteriaceae bacterium]